MLAAPCASADQLTLRGGVEIRGRIIAMDDRIVRIDVGSRTEVEFERARVVRIERDIVEEPARAQPKGQAMPVGPTLGLRLEAGLSGGWVFGEVVSSGRAITSVTGASAPLSGATDLGGPGAIPGLWVRCSWLPRQVADGPVFGVQAAIGGTSGSDATYRQSEVLVVTGWSWRDDRDRCDVLVLAGPALANLERSIQLNLGGTRVAYDDSASLSGWMAGTELVIARQFGQFEMGFNCGIDASRLSGAGIRTSGGGNTAEEELAASLMSIRAGIVIGRSW